MAFNSRLHLHTNGNMADASIKMYPVCNATKRHYALVSKQRFTLWSLEKVVIMHWAICKYTTMDSSFKIYITCGQKRKRWVWGSYLLQISCAAKQPPLVRMAGLRPKTLSYLISYITVLKTEHYNMQDLHWNHTTRAGHFEHKYITQMLFSGALSYFSRNHRNFMKKCFENFSPYHNWF